MPRRLATVPVVLLPALAACPQPAATGAAAPPPPAEWVTLRGRVVFPADTPIPRQLPVAAAPPAGPGGPFLDESLLVNPNNRGVRNVLVWLRPDNTDRKANRIPPGKIHPDDLTRKPRDVTVEADGRRFNPRIAVARPGDTLVFVNTGPLPHALLWASENNENINGVPIPPRPGWRMPKPLAPESATLEFRCTIQPWMVGFVRIFDHPYSAVTDADGAFEIKNAPAGKWRLVYWHERVGYKDGAKGRFGEPAAIADAGKGAMALPDVTWNPGR